MANVWRDAVPSTTISVVADGSQTSAACEQYFVPAGTLVFYDTVQQKTVSVVLESSGAYVPNCNAEEFDSWVADSSSVIGLDDGIGGDVDEPFFGSVIPIAYTISAATIVAWLLLILLMIAQKRRPWYQMFMMLFVATSLTTFLAHTTRVLQEQYLLGYYDAAQLRHHVFGSLSFRILEVLSILIIWVAQLQVILRLFNRAKERLTIKWVGSVLAVINFTLWCLVNFLVPNHADNHLIKDIIPVLAYLFQITIQVIYAGAVMTYSIRKRKYAYHRTSLITAAISIVAVLLPLVFFILDLADYWITGWSEFIRWVSGAGASVVLWEWIDAVERLEKEHQKTGVMGRQIYEDEDDMDFRFLKNDDSQKHDSGSISRGSGGAQSPTEASPPAPPAGTTTNIGANNGHTFLKKYSKRSIFPSFIRPGMRGWTVSRASSAGTTSTSYGTEIRLDSLGRQSRSPTTNNENRTEALQGPSSYDNPPPHPPPSITTSPSSHPHFTQFTAVQGLQTLETSANIPPSSNTPATHNPIAETPTVSPKSTPPPMVRHIHPLRRSAKRKHSLQNSEILGRPIQEQPTLSAFPNRISPPRQQQSGPSSSNPLRIPGQHAQREAEVEDENDDDDEEEEYYTVVRSEGFDLLQNGQQQQHMDNSNDTNAPPSFEPDPGFEYGDYWDDKHQVPP